MREELSSEQAGRPDEAANTNELIAAIYATTLSPHDYDATFDKLEALIFPDAAIPAEKSGFDSAALTHIDMARNIQERIRKVPALAQKLEGIVEAIPNPSFVISRSEAVLAVNRIARAPYERTPTRLQELVPDDATRDQIRRYVLKNSASEPITIAGFIDLRRDRSGRMMVSCIDPDMVDGTDGLFLLSVINFGFAEASVRAFRGAYDLSVAEAEVAVMVARGLRIAEIAERRSASVDTVRTQIKSIKSKTSVRDLPELVRLLCGFEAGTLIPSSFKPAAVLARTAPVKLRQSMKLSDQRNLDYLEQGAADGMPVVLFHNVPYGVELPEAAIAQAHRHGLRIIAPFRPGFGRSDPVTGLSQDDLVTRSADDLHELLQTKGIGRAALVSHSTGAPFALRYARLYPEAVSRLIGVSRAPAWRTEWLEQTPQRQRFMLGLARHLPQLLPVTARAMVACLDSRYAGDFVAHACKDGPADAKAVRNPETLDLIAGGCVEALRHHVDGLRQECLIVQSDFTDEARATPHKFHILHGDDDHIVPLVQSQTFAEDVPGTTIEIVKSAGQLLFYSHWQIVLDAILSGRSAAAR